MTVYYSQDLPYVQGIILRKKRVIYFIYFLYFQLFFLNFKKNMITHIYQYNVGLFV